MELAFLLRGVGTEVCWVTTMKPSDADVVVYSLEHKMLDRGVQVQNLNLFSKVIVNVFFCSLVVYALHSYLYHLNIS